MITIWDKYILKQFLSGLAFLLFGFYGLFVLLDFSANASHFPHSMESRILTIVTFYLCEFFNKLEILLTFALLITTIKTLCELNANNELIAMLASGTSLFRLMRPLLMIGLICTGLLYINAQFFVPLSLNKLKYISEQRRQFQRKKNEIPTARHLVLADNSILLFQNFDAINKQFYDVYWIKSFNELYRMEFLSPYETPPLGSHVDKFIRNAKEVLIHDGTLESFSFTDMKFNEKRLLETTIQPEELALTDLYEKIFKEEFIRNEKTAKILSVFYHKMMMPWLCLLAVIIPAPFCLAFSRNVPFLLLYGCFTLGVVSVHLITESMLVLTRRQILDPIWVFAIPLGLLLIPLLKFLRYDRLVFFWRNRIEMKNS